MPLPLIPLALGAASVASNLLKKKKKNPFNAAELSRINQDNENKQKTIVGSLKGNLAPLGTNYEAKRGALGNTIQTGTEDVIGQYGRDLSAANTADANTRNAANTAFREQSFRDVPEIQRSIRESLGGSGTMGNAAALSALSRPVLDANRSARDFTAQNEINGLNATAGRSEKLADTSQSARSGALQSKLGLDEGTINELYASGRGDLIDEANKLLGIEEQAGANRIAISQGQNAGQNASNAANAERRTGILSSLGSFAGGALGSFGGSAGIGLGSQLGGMIGNMAGGGSGGTFDPTLLYAMAQRNRSNISRSLGGGRSTPTTSNYSTMAG